MTRTGVAGLLPSCVVNTNETLRQRALRLVTLGCSQKIMAAKMGMQPATFSRWLNQKGIGPVSVTALDGFNAYVQELLDALTDTASGHDSGSATSRGTARDPAVPIAAAAPSPANLKAIGSAIARDVQAREQATARRAARSRGRPRDRKRR